MSDVKIRALERTAVESGSAEDWDRLKRERCRVGQHCACADPLRDCSVRLNRVVETHRAGPFGTTTTLQFVIWGDRKAVDEAVRVLLAHLPEQDRASRETLILDGVSLAPRTASIWVQPSVNAEGTFTLSLGATDTNAEART